MNILTILADHDFNKVNHGKLIFMKLITVISTFLFPKKKKLYKGHFAVTRSLISGLINSGVKFFYNPISYNINSKTCIVLSGYKALNTAIYYKNIGTIDFIIAGPNIVVLPSDFKGLIADKNIDLCIVPSQWVKELYLQEEPSLKGRIEIWGAGVDCNFWKKKNNELTKWKKLNIILFYIKNIDDLIFIEYENFLLNKGFIIKKLYYGRYSTDEYLKVLQLVNIAIFFSKSESQGIALMEAWATDTPTLVWNPGQWISPKGIVHKSSSAPYLNVHTGTFFSNLNQFKKLINDFDKISVDYEPRQWVCNNFSDEISANKLLKITSNIESRQ